MHPIALLLILIFVVVYLFLRQRNHAVSAAAVPVKLTNGNQSISDGKFLFISKGKLFINENGQIDQVHSPYIQEMIDRMERKKQLHGWKQNTSLNTSFTGQAESLAADQVDLQVVSAQFLDNSKLIYFMKDSNVGGLFEYDMDTKNERRLLHRQNLSYESMDTNATNGKILCAQQQESGISNIILLEDEGDQFQQITEGDTVDFAPAWIPGEDKQILYQSSGIARSEDGYVVAYGPSSIKLLDLEDQSVTSVMENAGLDFLQPRVDSAGNLYFIQRPYEATTYGSTNMLLDFILFPFRLLRAVFHYLNFFSLMYSRKPLTSASGPDVRADLKDILVKGKRIDAEKALRKENKVGGIPSLVPKSWQLVKRTKNGEETIVATNVASFDVTSNDNILYTNGYAVFQLQKDGQTRVVLKEQLIAEIVSS